MESKTVFMPAYSVGADVYSLVGELCKPHGASAVLIGGETALAKALPYLLPEVERAGIHVTDQVWYGGEASYENVALLAATPAVKQAEMIFAVGGGKCIDTAKVVSERLAKPIFTFPTIASNCAPCTKVCVMYEADGLFKDLFHISRPPLHTLISTRVIAEAPEIYLWAGIGDSLSKEIEVVFCSRKDQLDHSNALGVALAGACTWPLVEYAEAALLACRNHEINHALEQVVLDIVISTGLVSNMIIHDYNTSLAHAVYYTVAGLHRPGKQERLHGELVAYGVLLLALADGQRELFERIYAVASAIKLPTALADLELTRAEVPALAQQIVQAKDVAYGPYSFTAEMVEQAIYELEQYDQAHRQSGKGV